jgi:lysozyme
MKPRLSVTRQAVDLIKAFEGFRAKAAKLDDGRWTIGYGHTLTAREGAEIDERDAEALLLYDLIAIGHALNELIFAPVNQNQFDALASFVFNISVRGFRGSPTLRRLNEGRPLEAALAMELWRKSDLEGERIIVDSLVRRRSEEKALFLRPMDGYVAAPTPVLPPKIDYDAMALIPLSSPVATRAELTGERAYAEREPELPLQTPPEAPTASETAAAAVIERLEALMAEPGGKTPEPDAEPAPAAVDPEPVAAAPELTLKPEPAHAEPLKARDLFPDVVFEMPKPRSRGIASTLGLLFLGFIGIGLVTLGVFLHFESEYDQVMGLSPHTAGIITALAGIVCFSVAAYMMLQRLGVPRDRI